MRLAAAIGLIAALAAGPAASEDPAVAAAERASADLAEAVLALEKARGARDRVAALTGTIRAYEAGLSALRDAMRRVSVREAEITADFAARRDQISALLSVLATIGRVREYSGWAIAAMLATHDKVAKVYYPGLPTHEGHAIAVAQQEGFGAMLSLELKGDYETARAFVSGLSLFRLAQSLGGTESLINHPASMTHVSMGPEARAKAGVTDQLLRLSIGVEHIEDLLEDLREALAGI